MYLSKKREVFFIHIPKCGGVSIKRSLFPKSWFRYGHLNYCDVVNIYGEQTVKKMFTFTFVRNPWDRLYSAYKFLSQGGFNFLDRNFFKKELQKFANFEKFVEKWLNKTNIYKFIHFVPQVNFISIDGEINLDFIGRFENFDKDYKRIVKRIGFGKKLKHLNKTSKRKNYREVYTRSMIQKVAEIYSEDIDLFNYQFT
jgi:hypothetical protein